MKSKYLSRNLNQLSMLMLAMSVLPAVHASAIGDLKQAIEIKERAAFNHVRSKDIAEGRYPAHIAANDGMTPAQIQKQTNKANKQIEKQEKKIAHALCVQDPEYMHLKIVRQNLQNQEEANFQMRRARTTDIKTTNTVNGSRTQITNY
jgi:hypothetical protein